VKPYGWGQPGPLRKWPPKKPFWVRWRCVHDWEYFGVVYNAVGWSAHGWKCRRCGAEKTD